MLTYWEKATVLPVELIAIVLEPLTGIALGTWPARAAERVNRLEQYTVWLLRGLAGHGWHFQFGRECRMVGLFGKGYISLMLSE